MVTGRKMAQIDWEQVAEKLRENEERYRSLISNIPDVVWTTDEKYRVVFVSPNVESLLGYTQEELYQSASWMAWFKRVHPDDVDRAKAAFRALVKQGKHYDIEYRFKRKDGRWIWLLDRSVGTYGKEGRRYADGLFSNITERKQAEEKIHKFQQRLRSLTFQISLTEEQERRRLAIYLHDQISQTLAVIRLKLATLQQSSSNGYAEQVAKIQELVDQAIQGTRSLTFDLSPPILYELGLEAALEWLAEKFQKQHDIIFKFEDDGKPKPLTDACRGLLFMAMRELLVNVIKHAKAQNVSISIQRVDKKVRVIVQDDGVGFNSLQMERQTNGFGLFSIRERLRHVGGNFALKSRCGHGTRVSLTAPLCNGKGE
jgi:PAS domain S-box-containing protein